jgi:hypothetical protein
MFCFYKFTKINNRSMKKLLFQFLVVLLTLFSCSKDDNKSQKPIDQLPPATQTGANTAGCLVNGEAFLPKGTSLGGPILSCFYQQDQDGYHFGLTISEKKTESRLVNVSLNPEQLVENSTYSLVAITNGSANYNSNFGEFIIYSNVTSDIRYNTTNTYVGELKVTKLNIQQRIISGTFWYDAFDINNEKVEIREGRFDMHYVN